MTRRQLDDELEALFWRTKDFENFRHGRARKGGDPDAGRVHSGRRRALRSGDRRPELRVARTAYDRTASDNHDGVVLDNPLRSQA